MKWLLAALLAGAGCQDPSHGYAVELTLQVGETVRDPSAIASVLIAIGGADSGRYSLEQPFAKNPFAAPREERLVYHPFATDGVLTFDARALDGTEVEIAHASGSVTLRPGEAVSEKLVLQP